MSQYFQPRISDSQTPPSYKTHEFYQDISQENPIYEWMWEANTLYRDAAMQSDFVQGIANANLCPDLYGQFMLLDAAYCSHSADGYKIVIPRAKDPEVRAFCKARHQDYINYNAKMFSGWSIDDPKAVRLTELIQAYANFERNIAKTMNPLYFIVAMTPCLAIWTHVGLSLEPYADSKNLYTPWIKANQVAEAPKCMAEFINKHSDKIDHKKALKIFSAAMQFECNMFRSACGQPPI